MNADSRAAMIKLARQTADAITEESVEHCITLRINPIFVLEKLKRYEQ